MNRQRHDFKRRNESVASKKSSSEKMKSKSDGLQNVKHNYYDSDTTLNSNLNLAYDSQKDDDSNSANCASPTAWICEFGHEAFRPCFSNDSNTGTVHKVTQSKDKSTIQKSPTQPNGSNMKQENNKKTNQPDNNSRKKQSTIDFKSDDSDEEDVTEILSRISERRAFLNPKDRSIEDEKKRHRQSLETRSTSSTIPTYVTKSEESSLRRSISKNVTETVEVTGEPKIVAPNVSKLTTLSVVELKLQSANECVTVQCAVDVLKMRSAYFQDLLEEQERSRVHQGALLATSSSNSSISGWSRSPILIDEASPFEAAAFLECLHEGRSLLRGEWNACWARLSVQWGIEDWQLEYARQIENHTNLVLEKIRNNHWRTNPNILHGMRVAILRKGPTPLPTIVLGSDRQSTDAYYCIIAKTFNRQCVEAAAATGYSKIRVAFDVEKAAVAGYTSISKNVVQIARNPITPVPISMTVPLLSPSKADYPQSPKFLTRKDYLSDVHTTVSSKSSDGDDNPFCGEISPTKSSCYGRLDNCLSTSQSNPNQPNIFVGDIGEPFWVKSTKEGSSWYEPDDIFFMEAKKLITVTEKRVFWEMIRTIIELPQIATNCKGKIQKVEDLSVILKKIENRILWTMDGPACLPREIALELLANAYVVPMNILNQSD